MLGTFTIQSHKVFEVDTTINAFEKLGHIALIMGKYCNK